MGIPGQDAAKDAAVVEIVDDTAFEEALAMVARLPLSDEERAEAVRRLLA